MVVRTGLLPHQRTALADLVLFGRSTAQSGLVVAPTGAGKSRLLATFLAERVAEHGDRVLWVAHRRSLLGQAAAELTRALGGPVPVLTASELPKTSAAIAVVSVGSLATRPNAIRRWARHADAWLVLDEAHHAPARTFRRVIEAAKAAGVRVLGATATPTRTALSERSTLAALFDGNVVTRIAMQPLVEQSVLARASLVRLATGTVADDEVTPAELRRLARTGDLSPSWLRRLADLAPRNRAVLNHIAQNRARYGPTIVFAHDVLHAALVARRLRARGLRADYATGERPDGTGGSITDVITRFNTGALDVIVGVDALDEGVDLVRARTVILMRPTRSEIRLRQCIGRVLRGPALGGDAIAYVVIADDHWERVAGFHESIELVRDLFAAPLHDSAGRPPRGTNDELPSFESAARASEGLAAGLPVPTLEVTESCAVARMLTHVAGRTSVIPINALQLSAWRALHEELVSLARRPLREAEPEALLSRFFSPLLDVPAPPLSDVALVLAHTHATGAPPPIEEIDAIESPLALAKRIRAADLGEIARTDLLRQAYAGSARHLHSSLNDLRASVDAVLARMMNAA